MKSSARVQSWAQRKLSQPLFRVPPTLKWNPETGRYGERPLRADVYVFCLFAATTAVAHAAALNADHWRFCVAAGSELPDQASISWSRLSSRLPACDYQNLQREFEAAARRA